MIEIERLGDITLCIRENRVPIAFASLVCYLNQAEIVGLYVAPEHRQKGYATTLVKKLIEIAKEKGLAEVAITTNGSGTADAIAGWLGFQSYRKWVLRL